LCSRLLYKIAKIKVYRTVILILVLCGCEIWSLIIREESRLKAFENRLLRRIFGHKKEEITREEITVSRFHIQYIRIKLMQLVGHAIGGIQTKN
jgi:hypothetical protein